MSSVNDTMTLSVLVDSYDLIKEFTQVTPALMETFTKEFNDKFLLQLTEDIYNVDNILVNPPPDACEACKGRGIYNNEVCWHCEGERVDPLM